MHEHNIICGQTRFQSQETALTKRQALGSWNDIVCGQLFAHKQKEEKCIEWQRTYFKIKMVDFSGGEITVVS